MIIGRVEEIERLRQAQLSKVSEFYAVYGRRRVGKTFLIKEAFNYTFAFHHAGKSKGTKLEQIDAFVKSMCQQGFKIERTPRTWADAFYALENGLAQLPEGKKVVFLDELPWMDTPKSDFLSSLEHFWNSWATMRRDILLVVCGSATSWIVRKILKNKGGLHNRLSGRILLKPFTLNECERFAVAKGLAMTRMQILEAYMIMGGIPFYWDQLDRRKSLDQNIDALFFEESGELCGEFEELYASLFRNPEGHLAVVTALAKRKSGMTRGELLSATGITNNGAFSKVLEELVECGFLRIYRMPGKKSYDAIYQLIDNYTLFHFDFLTGSENTGDGWSALRGRPVRNAWCGCAFERVCLQHLTQLKSALGIAGVRTQAYAWRSSRERADGAQVDLLIDRSDDVINLCEMKFSGATYEIDKEESLKIANRRERFAAETGTRKAIFVTMVTTCGIAHNAYWNDIQSEVTLDDLFVS